MTPMNDRESVLKEADYVHEARGAARGDLWKESGARGQAFSLYAKSERVFRNLMSSEPNKEEILKEIPDIINYAIFCAILATAEDWNGSWPWPQ